ncbi:MAG: CoA transferase, partial [Rhodospirillales bacterium]
KNVAHWEERMYAEGVPFTRVNSIDRVAEEEQALARNMIRTVTHPEAGELKMAGLPIKFSDTSDDSIAAPPLLGEHSLEVLASLSYDQAAQEKLVTDDVIGIPKTTKAAE